jgi:hypothetical protein
MVKGFKALVKGFGLWLSGWWFFLSFSFYALLARRDQTTTPGSNDNQNLAFLKKIRIIFLFF